MSPCAPIGSFQYAGVADERPARSPRHAQVAGQPAEGPHAVERRGRREPVGQLGRRRHERSHGARPMPPRPTRAGVDAANTHVLVAVRRDEAGAGVGPEDPLVAVRRRARTSSRTRRRWPRCLAARSSAPTASATTERRPSAPTTQRARVSHRTPRPSRPSTPSTRPVRSRMTSVMRRAVVERGAGGASGVDEDRVEHGAARGVEGVDAVRRLDGDPAAPRRRR